MGSLNNLSSLTNSNPLDLSELNSQLHQSMELIMEYYKSLQSLPVLPQVDPGYLRLLVPSAAPILPSPFDATLCHLRNAVLPGLTHWQSPNFFAYFPAILSSAAIAGDLIASAFNPVAFNWLASPAATELEGLVLDWLAQMLQLPEQFLASFGGGGGGGGGGVIHGTASESMICTIVAAREAAIRRCYGGGESEWDASKLVVYGSDQTHSTFYKACRITGFHPTNIRAIPTHRDSNYSLDPQRLREAMSADVASGLVPTYVCATVGTTSSNAVDPVGLIADVAKEFGAWVHVDAAYAGSACICPEFRHYLDGVERADSVNMSPHKWLLTGLDCTCLWVRDRTRFTEPLGTDPEYLKNQASQTGLVVDFKDWQVGVGRRFRALKLWMVIQTYGVANLQAHIRSDVEMAREFEHMVLSEPRFEVVVPTRFALVCFRLARRGAKKDADVDAENRRLLELVNASGKAYMTHTVVGGNYVIRFAVGSTLTELSHVDAAWGLIKEKADEVLREN